MTDATITIPRPEYLGELGSEDPNAERAPIASVWDESLVPDWVYNPLWVNPHAFGLVLVRPLAVFRSLEGREWRAALGFLGGATLLRSTLFLMFGIGSDMTNMQIFVGTVETLVFPFVFVAAVFAIFLLMQLIMRRLDVEQGLSLAGLVSAPLIFRFVLQALATPVLQRTLAPEGLIGYLWPHAPATVMFWLAPIDVWGVWSLVLCVFALIVLLTPAKLEPVPGGASRA